MAHIIERVTEGCVLGEGPHWDVNTQSLYFVDIMGQSILKYTPATKTVTKASVAPKHVSFIVPVANENNQFIVSWDKELVIISWDGESDNISIVERLCTIGNTPETTVNEFNDGKCDPSGRLWAGTHVIASEFLKTQPLGSLYTLDSKRQLTRQIDKIRIANGLAFNDQAKKMYYIDSLKGTVDQFDFDIINGTLSNRQVLFTVEKHDIPGIPDGMTIDTDGNLWVAVFGGSRVLKIDGKKPETLLDVIQFPTFQVTSVAFGGPNLDELYVTSGSFEFEGQKPPPSENGVTYKVTGTGSKGLPAANFKLN